MKTAVKYILLLLPLATVAQKYDYNWMMGYYSDNSFDTVCQCGFGITTFKFHDTPLTITRDSLGINFNEVCSIMSDSADSLLFYSNGVQVNNANGNLIANGDSLGWGPIYTYVAPIQRTLGRAVGSSFLTLPNLANSNEYEFLYLYNDTSANLVIPTKLMVSKLIVHDNPNLDSVVLKDHVLLTGNFGGSLATVKHGNGVDWWVCLNEAGGNCHNILLFAGGDTVVTQRTCSGSYLAYSNINFSKFSPDGSLYVSSMDNGNVDVFNFDRCSGQLSLREQFNVFGPGDSSMSWVSSIEFSPDSRLMYVFTGNYIFQYDLDLNPISSGKIKISTYHFPGHHPSNYYFAQLAPDGKIYVSSSFSSYYLSVIDSPECRDSACGFVDQNFHLPTYVLGLPYYPNFRLGSLSNGSCDTLSSLDENIRAQKEKILKVYHNAAITQLTIDYGFTDWNKAQPTLEITNELGQTMYRQQLPMYSGFQIIGVSAYPPGVYMVFIKRSNKLVAAQKFVKE